MPEASLTVHPNQPPRVVPLGEVRIREDVLYTNHHGEEEDRVRRRAEKSLDNLRDVLARLLKSDEAVLWIARCEAPTTFGEKFTLGWYIYNVIASVLVLTNQRLLHFFVERKMFGGRTRWKWRRGVRTVQWGDVAEAGVKGWLNRALTLKYRDGSRQSFWRLYRDDAKKIKVLLEAILPGSVGEATPAQGIFNACPDCFSSLTPGIYRCGQCGLLFKDEATATWRSILIPGGGYFYTGHPVLGVPDALVEAMFLLILILFALDALGMLPSDPGEEPAGWLPVGVVLLILAFEKLLTIFHSRRFIRSYLPVKKRQPDS